MTMRRLRCLLAFAVCLLMGARVAGADAPLVGVWAFPGNAENVAAVFVFHGDGTMAWCTTALGPWSTAARYATDETAFPSHLDLGGFSDGSLRSATVAAIYQVDKDGNLRIEMGAPGATRPAIFTPSVEICRRADAEQVAVLLSTRPGVNAVQPDGKKWAQVKPGMTQQQVIDLLGQPLEATPPQEVNDGTPSSATKASYCAAMKFGSIAYPSPLCPADYQYMVFFSDQGVVLGVDDPMQQKVSLDGRPTVPTPVLPSDGASFDHYPRFTDLRWMPSSGVYPLVYDVQVAFSRGGDAMWVPEVETTTDIPCYTFAHSGANQARWRVRARNAKGASEWSPWRAFGFSR